MIYEKRRRALFKKGEHVRLKNATICGWKGMGTVFEDQLYHHWTVTIVKDDKPSWSDGKVTCAPEELVRPRKKKCNINEG